MTQKVHFKAKLCLFLTFMLFNSLVWTLHYAENLILYFFCPWNMKKTYSNVSLLLPKKLPGLPRQLKTHIYFSIFQCFLYLVQIIAMSQLMHKLHTTNACWCMDFLFVQKKEKKSTLAIVQNAVKGLQANAKLYTPSTTIN